MPTFGISIDPTWALPHSVKLSREAEKLGFSNVWVPDGGPTPPFSDCMVTLSAIASATKKIKFGSAIVNFYTRNPAAIASSFLALSNLGGPRQRAVIGIGIGAPFNISKFGIFARQGVIDDLREAIESIRGLFEGKEVSVRTDAFVIERVSLSKSRGKIPIYVGAGSPKGLELAGEMADGIILTERMPEAIEQRMKHVTLGLSGASRARKDIRVVNSVVISVSENKTRAREAAKPTCAYLVAWLDDDTATKHGIDIGTRDKIGAFLNSGDEKSAAKLVDAKMLDLLTACGTAEECLEKCREHLSYGIDQIAFCEPFGPDKLEAISEISRKIIRRL